MVRYIGKRLLQIIPIFFVVSVLIFALVRMSPTEPITVILGGKQSTQAAVQAAQEKFHLNESIVKQYFRWMMGMFHGDFGQSYKFQQSVGSMITERIPVTLGLVGFSSIIGIAIAIPAGVLCAVKKNTWVDRIISIITIVLVSCPVFLVCILMILFLTQMPGVNFTGMVTGCGGKKSESSNKTVTSQSEADEMVIGMNSDIIACDPAFAYDNNTNAVVDQITEGLLAYDQDNKLVSKLAKSWEQVDDVTYKYEIRDDVKFSDGTQMTADDVVFSLNRIKDPSVASYLNWMYANVDSIEKTGDWEVTVKLSTPDALWQYVPATTAGHVISQKFYEENKDDFGKPGTGIIGTGPYKFDSWTKDSEIVLSENENYWDKDNNAENAAKTLDYKIITEGTTLVSALQSGQVDLTMGLPTDQIPVIKKNDSLTITESDSFGTDYIAFNTQKAPFDDVNVRKAIYYALDRNQILDNITNGTVSEASASLINEALCTFNENDWKEYLKNVPDYEYNMEKAKEYLAKSSVPDGFECSIVCNQTATQNAEALLLQTALKELNITLNINKVTEDERVSTFMGGDGRNYDMIFCLWFSDFPDPAGNLNSVYPSTAGEEGGANAAVYNNSDVDTWLTEELASSDSTERTELMQKILDKVTDDVPYLVLDHPKVIMVTNSKVVEPKFSAEYQFNLFFKDFNLNK